MRPLANAPSWLLIKGEWRRLLGTGGRGADWQLLAAVVGIALGISLVVGVDLSIDAARRGHSLSVERASAGLSHRISRAEGTLKDADYVRLRGRWRTGDLPNVQRMAPLVLGRVVADGHMLDVVGVDFLQQQAPGTLTANAGLSTRLFSGANDVLLGAQTARLLNVAPGATLLVSSGGQTRPVTVAGIVGQSSDARGQRVVLADIAVAQELLNSVGQLSAIDVQLRCSNDETFWSSWFPGINQTASECVIELESALGTGYRVDSLQQGFDEQTTAALYFNLGALGLLAAAVAAFLVYQVMALSTIRRGVWFGRLRSVGVTGFGLGAWWVTQAVILALLGALLGIGLGRWLAGALVLQVVQVVDDLYYRVVVTDLRLNGYVIAKALLLAGAMGASAALLSIWRIGRSNVAVLLSGAQEHRAKPASWWLWVVPLLAAGAMLVLSSSIAAALGALGLVLLVGAVLAGRVGMWLPLVWRRLAPRFTRAPLLALAAIDLTRTATELRLAMAAIVIATSAALGMGWMIDSFAVALQTTLDERLPSGVAMRFESDQPLAVADELARIEGVTGRIAARGTRIWLGDWQVQLRIVYDPEAEAARLGLPADAVGGGKVALSEPLARRLNVAEGDRFSVAPGAERVVGGVFKEYGNVRGTLVIAHGDARGVFPDSAEMSVDSNQAVMNDLLLLGVLSADAVNARLPGTAARVFSSDGIRELSLEIFHRTFAVTRVVRVLTLIVAALALYLSLAAWVESRLKELGALRALGLTSAEVARLLAYQSGLLGMGALLVAVPTGAAAAWMLVGLVNPRAFGWSYDLRLAVPPLLEVLALSAVALAAGALAPSLRLLRFRPAQLLGHAE